MDNFHYEGKPSHATAKSTPFAVSKDEWDTKEDTGKSMKNALCMPKGTCTAKATLNSGKIKPIALHLSESISQLVTQSVTH